MRRLGVVGVVVALAMTLLAGSAVADPPSGFTPPGLTGDPYVCDGFESMVFGGNGRSGWLNGDLYQAVSAEGSFYFEPWEGEPESGEYYKTWGKGPAGDTVECTQSGSGEDAEGYFEWEVTVTAVKVPGH
jgi:hypothetical protein